jgi:hypothetical protein
MKLPNFRTWIQAGVKSRFIQAMKKKLVLASSNLNVQIAVGFVGFIAVCGVVWQLTDVPVSKTELKKREIAQHEAAQVADSQGEQAPAIKKPSKIANAKLPSSTAAKQPVESSTSGISGEGELAVASAPSGAKIVLDGQAVGNTPYSNQKILDGPHQITVEKLFYIPISEKIYVDNGAVSGDA